MSTVEMAGSNVRADLYVFNGGGTTANMAVNILDRDGTNLMGATIPGSSPPTTYPGQSGASTVPLLAAHTLNLTWVTPKPAGRASTG